MLEKRKVKRIFVVHQNISEASQQNGVETLS